MADCPRSVEARRSRGRAVTGRRSLPTGAVVNLTPRQIEVLTGLSFGLTYQEIADELGISLNTMMEHAKDMRRRLGAVDSAQAVAFGFRYGILQPFEDA